MAIDPTPPPGSLRARSVAVRPIAPDEEQQWNQIMDQQHQLGAAQFPGHRIKYVAEIKGHAVGLVCFSACALHLADRDRHIGWTGEQASCRRHFLIQNSRLLILSEKERNNLASRVLGACAKRIAADWLDRFGFEPLMLETFVDPQHFRGTCYQAAGWQHIGTTRGCRRDGTEFYAADSTPKKIYVKALHYDAQALLRAEKLPQPYAKWEKPLPAQRVADRLGFDNLRSLFSMLNSLPDTRGRKGRRYPLGCCLSLVVCAVLGGCKGLRDCAEFAANLKQDQLRALRCWKDPKTGRHVAPKATTFWRIVAGVDAERFEQSVNTWLNDTGLPLEAIAIDGKALRATLHNEDGGSFAVNALSHRGSSPFFSKNSPTAKARS